MAPGFALHQTGTFLTPVAPIVPGPAAVTELAARSAATIGALEGTPTTIADPYEAAGDLKRLSAEQRDVLRVAVPRRSAGRLGDGA